jgi:hypothetical protein
MIEAIMVKHLHFTGDKYALNPIELGAVGDGISDDSAPIQALIDHLSSERGGKLSLPPRKFRLASPVRIYTKSISIDGGANGFGNSPNAEHESLTGSEISSESNAFEIGNDDPGDIARGCHKLGAINFRDIYLWGPGVYTGKKAFYFEKDTDQSQFNNIHIGNFQWGLYSNTVLDNPNFSGLDITHCFQGIHLSAKSLAAYVKFHHCTIADNDGTGIFIHPASNSFCCQLTHCVIVRNARTEVQDGCNVYWGAREGIIANNIIHAAGYHFYNEAVLGNKQNRVPANGIIVEGSDNLITGNQILDHTMGSGIVIKGCNNKAIHNLFTGRVGSSRGEGSGSAPVCKNRIDIDIKPGVCDTTIIQQGQFTINDEGIRTIVNGISKNQGDPDHEGDWKGVIKSDGLVIYDSLKEITYLYGHIFPNGRINISTNPASHSALER